MLSLIEQLVKQWLTRKIDNEVFVLNHRLMEEIPVGFDVVIKIEMWQPLTTPTPGYDADLTD
jgi:hypothetical protein